ncbi:helix-turn-helix transcriptional regulator [Dysgonomonas sp. HDW5A]|uniref:winged helix-turn-helix transcriptional regulator n=1 Tax=Dysgonomonas sp. HDW5A TaxID=2714926 RepID=UPI00140B5422|nr:helix-turn-helix domain-containing protein [Dysgonomonas sp. HDW5A]QIK59183.1 helix-turn-helix transcriptional regulator [Dysgonomonas sp. HDW5A]
MGKINKRSNCPIGISLDLIGDRWTLLIVRDIIIRGKRSYGEFLKSDENISTNILASRLQFLEVNNLVTKKIAADNKSKFIYSPTDKMIALFPTLCELMLWGNKYDSDSYTEPSNLLQELKDDKKKVIEKYILLAQKSKQ